MNQLRFLLKCFATIILLYLNSNSQAQASGNEASAGDKKVTIIAKALPLSDLFKSITKQTGLRFSYNNSDVNKNERITAPFVDMPVDKVLKHIFAGKPLSWVYIDNIVRIGKSAKEQGPSMIPENPVTNRNTDTIPLINVNGQVTDASGRPISGATISLRGQSRGQGTDNAGNFGFSNVPANATLMVSSIGFETKSLKLSGQRQVRITLDSLIQTIQGVEVVSTGYQTIPRERSTGSFAQVSNKVFNEQVGTTILERLEGIANGLAIDKKRVPGTTTGLVIRGLSTLQGQKDPLIVVDDFPYDGSLDNLNPNDVETITVLKDAAAASIWGSRAGNGVIVITTKKGRFNQPLAVSFNSNITIADKTNLFYLSRISSNDFVDAEKFLFDKNYRFSDTNNVNRPAFSPVYEILFRQRAGQISADEANAQLSVYRNTDARNQFNKYVYEKAVNQQYAINLRGGNNDINYSFSVGYDRNSDELASTYERINLRANTNYRITKRLTLATAFSYVKAINNSGKTGINNITAKYPYTAIADENGNALPVYNDYRKKFLDTLGGGKLLNWNYYPLTDYKYSRAKSDMNDFVADLGLQYKILQGLTVDVKYQYEKQQVNNTSRNSLESFFTRDLINKFTQIDYTAKTLTYKVPVGAIIDNGTIILQSQKLRGQLNFNHTQGEHNINALAGMEVRELKNDGNVYRIFGFNEKTLSSGQVDYTTTYPNIINGIRGFIPTSNNVNSTINRYISYYANATYTFRNKYSVSGSARKDGSNLFGVNTNDKWKPLWSVGAGWVLSNEDFYTSKIFPYLKLRATYGFSGNADLNSSAYTTISYYPSLSQYTQTAFAQIDRFGNPELRWEKIGMFNLGVDYRAANNRIFGSVEYFRKKGTDLLGSELVDYTTGIGYTITKNTSNIKGSGVDVEINTINIDRKLKWTSTLMLNVTKDEVTKYLSGSDMSSVVLNMPGSSSPSPVVGKPIHSIYSYRWAGLDPATGDPLGYIKGEKSKDYNAIMGPANKAVDLVYNGPAFPTQIGAFRNTFTYAKVSLSFNIIGKFNYFLRKASIRYSDLFASGIGTGDYADRWKVSGDELKTHVPSMSYPSNTLRDNFYSLAEVNVIKGDHIRLQYVNVSYDFGKLHTSLPLQLQVYANVNDIGILWRANKDGLDPDYLATSIPPSRSYSLGLRASF